MIKHLCLVLALVLTWFSSCQAAGLLTPYDIDETLSRHEATIIEFSSIGNLYSNDVHRWQRAMEVYPKLRLYHVDTNRYPALGQSWGWTAGAIYMVASRGNVVQNCAAFFPEEVVSCAVRALGMKEFRVSPERAQELIDDSSKHRFVMFYAPWSGHCTHATPGWRKIAKQLEKRSDVTIIQVAGVDPHFSTPYHKAAYEAIGNRYHLTGFPHFAYFPRGKAWNERIDISRMDRAPGSERDQYIHKMIGQEDDDSEVDLQNEVENSDSEIHHQEQQQQENQHKQESDNSHVEKASHNCLPERAGSKWDWVTSTWNMIRRVIHMLNWRFEE